MKIFSTLSILGLVVFLTVPALAGSRVIPTAPAEFLEMENTYDPEDVEAKFLKKAGKIYKRKCKKCHGTDGDGNGTAAADMKVKPTSFTESGYMENRKDGQLFWIIRDGSPDTEMKAFGPGTDVNLSEDEIWRVITFMRNAFTN
ncbi:MAG: cytochrome c [Magnetococcales bacterium]|nr:cytochrome c [Magnetococcales bacterium]